MFEPMSLRRNIRDWFMMAKEPGGSAWKGDWPNSSCARREAAVRPIAAVNRIPRRIIFACRMSLSTMAIEGIHTFFQLVIPGTSKGLDIGAYGCELVY